MAAQTTPDQPLDPLTGKPIAFTGGIPPALPPQMATLTPYDPAKQFPGNKPGTVNSSLPPLTNQLPQDQYTVPDPRQPKTTDTNPLASPESLGPIAYSPQAAQSYMQGLLDQGVSPQEVADRTNKQFGLVPGQDGAALYYPGNNTIGMHEFYMAGVGGKWNAVQRGPEGPAAEAAPPALPTDIPGAGGYAVPSVQPRTDAPTASASDQLLQQLLQRARQGAHVDRFDPAVRAQADAYNAQQQQAERRGLAALAERAGPSANLSAETRAGNEQVGQATGQFEAQLIQQELTARRDEIQHALTSMQAYLSDQQKMELERQLAEMNNALQYASLGQSGSQFDRSLAERAYEFDTNYQNGILGS